MPGDLEASRQAKRLAEGIELDDTTWNQIVKTAEDVGVDSEQIEATKEIS